jgi:acetyl esterase/lipase
MQSHCSRRNLEVLSYEKLPPPYIQVAGLDPLRDEALLHARLLRECGVLTNFDVCVGFLSTAAGFGPWFLRRSSSDILASRMGSTSPEVSRGTSGPARHISAKLGPEPVKMQ